VGVASRLVLVGAAAAIVGCHAQPNPVALRWLSQDCTVGERGRLETQLRHEGLPAESTLITAFERGPGTELLDEVAAEAGSEYDEIASALAAGRTYGLSGAELASIRASSREVEVRRAREEFERSYKASALSGLAVISLTRGKEVLRRVAADPNSPNRAIARVALQRAGIALASP
jgi:hypothetical protein